MTFAGEYMKVLGNRWCLMILGLLIGAFIGGDLTLRYIGAQKIEYDQALEDHYIQSRIWAMATSMPTIMWTELEKSDRVLRLHRMMLRSVFLELVSLHKTGHYDRKDADIREYLKRAKSFMTERPDDFLNQEFFSLSSIVEQVKTGDPNDPEVPAATDLVRNQLQDAIDYVDRLNSGIE